jgi:hypothetical protein
MRRGQLGKCFVEIRVHVIGVSRSGPLVSTRLAGMGVAIRNVSTCAQAGLLSEPENRIETLPNSLLKTGPHGR